MARRRTLPQFLLALLAALIITAVASYLSERREQPIGWSFDPLDAILRSLKSGAIAFITLPEPIDYGEIKTIQLLLNPSKSPVELQQLLTEKGLSETHEIRVSDRMEAQYRVKRFRLHR